MIQARAWPVRAMYILIAAALAIGLFITAAPAHKVSAATDEVKAEWSTVDTPTMDGFVLAPGSTIYDYALASEGHVAYAVVYAWNDTGFDVLGDRLLKSEDGAATWTDLTDTLMTQLTDDGYTLDELLLVATDWVNPEFVAVALAVNEVTVTPVHVYISNDGGDTFVDALEVEAGIAYLTGPHYGVSDLAVSLPVDDVRDIAIGGRAANTVGGAGIFRCTVTGDSPGSWKDATTYSGWDDNNAGGLPYGPSFLVTDIIFSPNWETDGTILVTSVAPDINFDTVYLQSGTLGKTTGAWNADAGFADAVAVKVDVPLPLYLEMQDARGIAGVALPSNYAGDDSLSRYSWVWVNYYDVGRAGAPTGEIIMVLDNLGTPVNQQIVGMPWLTNVSYLGTIAQGKAIAGVLGDGSEGYAEPCGGVRVYHTQDDAVQTMNICCKPWEIACKLPTGMAAMAVSYVDANNPVITTDKAYAVALQDDGPYDESAWSVSVDGNGLIWNQLSLVDTEIDYISDVAVSPNCNKMMLVSVNLDGCDSVWLKAGTLPEAEEYSDHWIRTWCGRLMGDNSGDFPWVTERGLLRLAPVPATGGSEEEAGTYVYLVDRMTDTVYYNDLETWNCWKKGASTVDYIVDLAVEDEATVFALGDNGDVAMSYDHARTITWTDPVASEVDRGWTIAVRTNNVTNVLVGGQDGDVSYSDDFDPADNSFTFTALDKVYDASDVHVTVAFDTYFDTNDTVYAALANAGFGNNGIFSTTIPDSTGWTDLDADSDFNYTGLVLSYASGNTFTSPETGGVLYASYFTWTDNDGYDSGVARCLTPLAGAVVCSSCHAQWDYLTYGLDTGYEDFVMVPLALKMCGCLSPDTLTKLFAIDGPVNFDRDQYGYYDIVEGQYGTVWTFEDCYAKKAAEITSPADGATIGTSACGCCNVPFTVRWAQLCDACYYDIQFALDAAFTEPVELIPATDSSLLENMEGPYSGIEGTYYTVWPDNGANPTAFLGCYFTPETTYYWRLRAAGSGDQEIHSWWSDGQSFTIAPTAAAGAIELVAPAPGDLNVPPKNLGFSWQILADVDNFDWVLSKNADLSAPVQSKPGLTGTATTYSGMLDYGTTYYWQVTAYKGGAEISRSAVGTFTTAPTGAFCCPQDGLCFATQAELVAHNAEHGPAPTPFWVWIVIAIGAVLVIVVIVLIFRTRRV